MHVANACMWRRLGENKELFCLLYNVHTVPGRFPRVREREPSSSGGGGEGSGQTDTGTFRITAHRD